MKKSMEEDEAKEKKFNISCCRSYLTPKGRCYTCPELENEFDLVEQKDQDEEQW